MMLMLMFLMITRKITRRNLERCSPNMCKKVNDLQGRSELDRYLHDGPVPETNDFDILAWWKIHASNYPIIAEIACNILIVPISSATSKSAFSINGHVLD